MKTLNVTPLASCCYIFLEEVQDAEEAEEVKDGCVVALLCSFGCLLFALFSLDPGRSEGCGRGGGVQSFIWLLCMLFVLFMLYHFMTVVLVMFGC